MRARMIGLAVAGAAVAAVPVVVRLRGRAGTGLPARRHGRYATIRAITVNQPPEAVYAFWRDPQRLALAVGRNAEVEALDDRRYRWRLDGPAGRRISWEAELISDEPPRVIAWRTGTQPLPHEGRVEFDPAPGDRGTEVRVGLTYRLPGGPASAAVARLTGDEPDQILRTVLRRVKQLLETGEVITVDGQVSGRGPVRQRITEFVDHKLATGGRP